MKKELFGALVMTAIAASMSSTSLAADKKTDSKTDGHATATGDMACQNNDCKGKADCAGFGNASCKGGNECKGKGMKEAKNEKECKGKKGKWMKKA